MKKRLHQSMDTHVHLPKTLYDELYQLKKMKKVSINALIVSAVEEFVHPTEKEGFERETRQKLNSILNFLKSGKSKDDVIIILLTEVIKNQYYNTTEIDRDFVAIQKERMNKGLEAVMKRIEDQLVGNKKGVLDRLELDND